MKIKFCGIRRMEDVALMNEFKPDYVGFVFAKSKRQVDGATALVLADMLDKSIQTVGVFVDEVLENVVITTNLVGLNVVQLHGNEDEGYIKGLRRLLPNTEIWKAVRVSSADDILKVAELPVDLLLLDSFSADAHGGTGKVANLSAIQSANLKRDFLLAGGLNSENISEIVKEIQPYGLDISSGIEVNGFKNSDKIIEIMRCFDCLR